MSDKPQLRPDDIVLIRARVVQVDSKDGTFLAEALGRVRSRVWVSDDAVECIEKPALQVGDIVDYNEFPGSTRGLVVGIADGTVWVQWRSGTQGLYERSALSRSKPDEKVSK